MTDYVITPKIEQESRWSLFSWSPTSNFKAVIAETKLLSRQLLISGKGRGPAAEVGLVNIGDDLFINTLLIPSQKNNFPRKNLVITHGYGAGLGFFFRNYAAISKHSDYDIHSIDWLGMANSSRPTFPKAKRTDTEEFIINQTEDFFVNSLEEWRKRTGIDKMTLMGHSLGGYLSTAYSLKYPERVEKLILVSPVGVPIKPEPRPDAPKMGYLMSLAISLWKNNITPMSIIRGVGPFGVLFNLS